MFKRLSIMLLILVSACGQDAEIPDIPAYVGPPIASNVLANQDSGLAPQNETTIAIDPSNRRRLVGGWNDYRTGLTKLGYSVSEDGGSTWRDGLINEPENPEQGDPAVAAANDGSFYMAMISFNRVDNRGGIYVARKPPGAATFDMAVRVQAENLTFEDKEYIAVDNSGGDFDGSIYVSWTDFDDARFRTGIMLSRSTDQGKTWSPAVSVSGPVGYQTGYVQGSVPAVGRDGALYVVWYESIGFFRAKRWPRFGSSGPKPLDKPSPLQIWSNLTSRFIPDLLAMSMQMQGGAVPNRMPGAEARTAGNFADRIMISRSIDGGRTFESPVAVAPISPAFIPGPYRTNQFPSIAIAPGGGRFLKNDRIYVCFSNGSNVDSDIFVTVSENSGKTFSSPVRVNDDGVANPQFFPWMAADQTGAVHVIWYDLRNDPLWNLIDVYYSKSTDGGRTFSANHRVTPQGFDPYTNFDGQFIGDYNGVAAYGGVAYALFTDTRRGHQDAFFAPLE